LVQSDSIKLVNLQSFENPITFTFPILANSIEFIVSEDGYSFIGNSFTNQIGIYNFHPDNAEIEDVVLPDIELLDFNIDNISIAYYQFQEDSFAMGYSFNTELTVKNSGNNTIHSFAIYSDLHGDMNCVENYFYQKFSDLEILPGQTHKVQLQRAYEDGVNNNQLCFQCVAPNSNLEILTNNNSLCKTFTITSVKNEIISNVKVYPNPVSDYLTIENPDQNFKSIEIFDIYGKLLIRGLVSGQSVRIETANLTSGLYILKINSDDKTKTQLIMKK
jgi:hypothetical protein